MCASLYRIYKPNNTDFLDVSKEKIFELIDSLYDEELCKALSVLLAGSEDAEWFNKALKKVMTRCLRIHDKARQSEIYFILKQQIFRLLQNQQGEDFTHALIFLAADKKWVLPDELVNFLVINSEIYHWLPLLTDAQRVFCLNELLKNADTQKKYLNLLLLLSPDSSRAEQEVRMIMEDMFHKNPSFLLADFTPEHHHYKNHLMILTVLPALLLCLDKTRHQELLHLLLAQLKKGNALAREAILNILFECIPYLEDSRLFIFKAVRPYLDNVDLRVRLAAQKVLSSFSTRKDGDFIYQMGSSLYQHDSNQFTKLLPSERKQKIKSVLNVLSVNNPLLPEESFELLSAALHYMSADDNDLVVQQLLMHIRNKDTKIRKAAAKFLAKSMHHFSKVLSSSIIIGALPLIKDENWFVRASFWEILNAAIPHLEKSSLEIVFPQIVTHFSDTNWIIQDYVLKALPQLFPLMSPELSNLALTHILTYLEDSDWSQRYAGLQTLTLFITYSCSVQPSLILQALLPKTHDKNSIVCGMAMQALISLIAKMDACDFEKVLDAVLQKIDDPNSYVAQLSRKVLMALMPRIDINLRDQIISLLFDRLNQQNVPQISTLRDMNICLPHMSREWGIKLFNYLLPILNQQNKDLVATCLEILNLCVKYLEPEECKEISYSLFPRLLEENSVICNEALKVILHCGIYLSEDEWTILNNTLEGYMKQHSISLWCDNLDQYYANEIVVKTF